MVVFAPLVTISIFFLYVRYKVYFGGVHAEIGVKSGRTIRRLPGYSNFSCQAFVKLSPKAQFHKSAALQQYLQFLTQ
jgi:hypothetical protein